MSIVGKLDFAIDADGEFEVAAESDLRLVANTVNDLGTFREIWEEALAALEGRTDLPFWTGGDEYELKIDCNESWFGVQGRSDEGVKLANADAKEVIIAALRAIDTAEAQG